MTLFLRTLIAVMPMLMIWMYVRGMFWGSAKSRNIIGFLIGFAWSLAFGVFCGITGFLKD